jgi:pilus assembly protein Flp/PilA
MPRFPTGRQVGKVGFAMRFLYKFFSNEQAATAVEYAVMLALILLAVIGAIGSVGLQTGGMWSGIITKLTSVGFFGG